VEIRAQSPRASGSFDLGSMVASVQERLADPVQQVEVPVEEPVAVPEEEVKQEPVE
jgi:hypothetical protein